MPETHPKGFNIFSYHEEIVVSRVGKNVTIKTRDGAFQQSDTVTDNLLFEILKALRKK